MKKFITKIKKFLGSIFSKKRFYFLGTVFIAALVILDIEECAVDSQIYDQKINIAEDDNRDDNSLANLPLASKSEINELSEQSKKDKNIIDPDVARKIALVEFESWRDSEDKFINAKFNKEPIVIYDSLTSLPKFYEFLLVDGNGNPLATVTTYAQKVGYPIIRNVMPFIRNYNNKVVTKSANQKVFDDGVYPSRIHYGVVTKSGGKASGLINGLTGKNEKVENKTYEQQKEFLQNLTQQQRENAGITNLGDYINKVENLRKENDQENKEYWKAMDMVATNIIKMSDEEIEKKLAENRTKGSYKNFDYVIPEYENIENLIPAKNKFCVPSAFTWVYWGLYNSYKGFSRPSSSYSFNTDEVVGLRQESKRKDGGLYEFFVSRLAANSAAVRAGRENIYKNGVNPWIGDFNKYNPALSDATGGKYGIIDVSIIIPFHGKTAVRKHILKHELPVFMCRLDRGGHTRVAYGTRKHAYTWKKWVKIFWWGYWDKGEKYVTFYYKLHDNGTDVKQNEVHDYWEKQGSDDTGWIPGFILTSQKGVVKK